MRRSGLPLLTVLVLTAGLLAGCEKRRTPEHWEIPEGFSGWVVVHFGLIDRPELEVVDGHLMMRVDDCPVIETSTPLDFGAALDRRFEMTADGPRQLITTWPGGGGEVWGGVVRRTGSKRQGDLKFSQAHFFGTEQAWRRSGGPPWHLGRVDCEEPGD